MQGELENGSEMKTTTWPLMYPRSRSRRHDFKQLCKSNSLGHIEVFVEKLVLEHAKEVLTPGIDESAADQDADREMP